MTDGGQVWLVGATVYTHLYDDDGVVYDTVTDVTDPDGRFELAVPSGKIYDVFVARGNDLVSTVQIDLTSNPEVELPGDGRQARPRTNFAAALQAQQERLYVQKHSFHAPVEVAHPVAQERHGSGINGRVF